MSFKIIFSVLGVTAVATAGCLFAMDEYLMKRNKNLEEHPDETDEDKYTENVRNTINNETKKVLLPTEPPEVEIEMEDLTLPKSYFFQDGYEQNNEQNKKEQKGGENAEKSKLNIRKRVIFDLDEEIHNNEHGEHDEDDEDDENSFHGSHFEN